MDCPHQGCGAWSSVKETRQREGGILRTRCCANGHRFKTVERVEVEPDLPKERETGRLDMILKLMINYGKPMKTGQIEKALWAIEKVSSARVTLLRDLRMLESMGLITLDRKSTRTMLWDASKQG